MICPTEPRSFRKLSLFPITFIFFLGGGSVCCRLCSLNNSRSEDLLFLSSTSLALRQVLSSSFLSSSSDFFLTTSALLLFINFKAISSFFHWDLLGGKDGTRTDLRRWSTSEDCSFIVQCLPVVSVVLTTSPLSPPWTKSHFIGLQMVVTRLK